MKKNNKKGFTMAELLIVVAIVAVLVAIAIPVFSAQLEKSRQAVDQANLRSAYAQAMADLLDDNNLSSTTITLAGQTFTAASTTDNTNVTVTLTGGAKSTSYSGYTYSGGGF